MIKLCYKEYEIKDSLSAIDKVESQLGFDLYGKCAEYIHAYHYLPKGTQYQLSAGLSKVLSFVQASKLLHILINASGSKVELSEIQDAMFHVGSIPTDRDDAMSDCWPDVVLYACVQVMEAMFDRVKKS